jgi:hypothetical protein
VTGAYYFARFDGTDAPGNHSLVVGGQRFWAISFNRRQVFVDANDVVALPRGRERAAARGRD